MRASNRITDKELEYLVYRVHDGLVGLCYAYHMQCYFEIDYIVDENCVTHEAYHNLAI